MFILFEGLDLSGKSTLCRELGARLGWQLRRNSLLAPGQNPNHALAERVRFAGGMPDSELGQLYLDALRFDLDHFSPCNEPVIQDSTLLLRSLAHHVAAGHDEIVQGFRALIPRHPSPRLTFVCRPALEVRLHRLQGRISRGNAAEEDLIVRDDPRRFSVMEAILQEQAQELFGAELLDTSDLEDVNARTVLVDALVQRLRDASHTV